MSEKDIVGGFLTLLTVILFICFFVIMGLGSHNLNIACKDIGLNDFVTKNGMQFCSDFDGNLFYVNVNHGMFFNPFDVSVKKITVGNVIGELK